MSKNKINLFKLNTLYAILLLLAISAFQPLNAKNIKNKFSQQMEKEIKSPLSSLFLDLTTPGIKVFTLKLSNKITFDGQYILRNKRLTGTLVIKNISIPELSTSLGTIKNLEIESGEIFINKEKSISAKGKIKIKNIYLPKKLFHFQGQISLEGAFTSTAPGPYFLKNKTIKYSLKYNIAQGSSSVIKNISAQGIVKNDLFSIGYAEASYKDIPFTLSGELKKFSHPSINLNLRIPPFNLIAKIKYSKKLIDISELTIESKSTKIVSYGKIIPLDKTLSLFGNGYIDFFDIKTLMASFKNENKLLRILDPKGVIDVKFILKIPEKIKDWGLELSGLSKKMEIYSLITTDMSLSLSKNNNTLTISPLLTKIAHGKIEIRSIINLLKKTAAFNLIANDLDITQISNELNLKKNKYSGKLSLEAYIKNINLSTIGNLKGTGKIAITEGSIWQIDFLRGLGEFLFIPAFEEIIFREGYSDLVFKNNNIIFENLELISDKMTLFGKGNISLNGDINFSLIPDFNTRFVDSHDGLKKYITNILGETGLAIEVGGTIKKPTYNTKSFILSPINRVKDFIEGLFIK